MLCFQCEVHWWHQTVRWRGDNSASSVSSPLQPPLPLYFSLVSLPPHLSSHSPSTFSALFLRWVSFTQESKMFHEADLLVLRQRRLRTLGRFFSLLRTSLPNTEAAAAAESAESKDKEMDCFPMQRVSADLDQVSKRFFAIRRRGLVFCMRRENRAHLARCKQRAKAAPTFKSFKAALRLEVTNRLGVEQRVVSQSFQSRGRCAAVRY
jgi:hypothetical protein